jgi:hypothetical protein
MKTLLAAILLFACPLTAAQKFDLVVYGGTAGGVMTAVSAAREGLKTALVEPGRHIGGMVSGGLGFTDFGRKEVIGGLAMEFYYRVGRHYELNRYGQEIGWYHEPHVAEAIFRQMLAQAKVSLFEQHRIRPRDGVLKEGSRIKGLACENSAVFEADIFADCSYEGELMAQAGVSYTWGREGESQYGESLAGVRDRTPYHQFAVDVPARDSSKRLLREINDQPPQPPGSADRKVQAYNFRMCFSDDPANQVPFPMPEGYSPDRYELLARLLKTRTEKEGKAPILNSVIKVDRLPNRKADINNQGAFSTDYLGGSWEYPEASYEKKAEIWNEHRKYQAGFFYFLANDPRVPEPLKKEIKRWGLCRDEFADTGHWPNQLYIREARRMIGSYVVVQKDLQTELNKPDPIGMGSYNSDSHNVQRIVDAAGFARNEGDMQVAVQPYQIPYRVMLPKKNECPNLMVPVAFSASHVAYSSLRMEPQYMIIGQAAGVAAGMARAAGIAVQDIDAKALTQRLLELGAVMEYSPSAQNRALETSRKAIAAQN